MVEVGAVTFFLQESQKVAGIFTFAVAITLTFMQLLLTKSESPPAIFLPLFPLTSPVAMLVRIGASYVPFYLITTSFFILFVSIHGVIVLSSRFFRAYLLMYGKKPPQEDCEKYSGREPVKKQKLFFQVVHVYRR
ncbi:hypothetical protein RG963_09585 [Methanosarcina sp. Z-7115]|uniref:Uncharacterized protein n=1 Tax=Methanosarcina baikalica TaxID=3073890 RepID=A0ABU2D210_9EURY|nr:hypothetical protein [Methanosarcina sp. Z-7115]MDR7666019.1 hypothetical protein [Methanosarcina sp. Z-7115]